MSTGAGSQGAGATPQRDAGGPVKRAEVDALGASARKRLLISSAVGVVAGLAASLPTSWRYGIPIGWMVAAAVFMAWMWVTIWPMDADATSRHAIREDAGRAATDAMVVIAAVASLGAVGLLLLEGGSGSAKNIQAAVSFGSVAMAWAMLHTMFTARYARLYYIGEDGGVDFNEDVPPRYSDFAYLAFTIGMTFQVSDTDLKGKDVRATALRHALLSYLFGVVIIATTINLVAGLSK